MPYAQGIAFRATSGYVSDGATDSFEAGGASATYPRTTAQGNVVGWEQPIGNTRDRSTTVDHRLAGIHYTVSSQEDFRFDLPAAGTYNIRLAAGDMSSVNNTAWSVVDGTTVLGTLASGTNGANGSFKDATNAQLTAAAWPGSNTAATFTFSSTICRIRSSSAAAADVIAYVYVEAAAGGSTTVSPTGASVALTGNAPTISQPRTVAPSGASLGITGFAPAVVQSIAPSGAVLAVTGNAPTVSQSGVVTPPAGGGGGAGNVREVRRFADLLDKAHKPSRTQRKKRRAELVAEALELLPDLPEAAAIAPVAARIVYEQEAAARATAYANRPIEAMAPVVIPFDAHAALRGLIARLLADEHMHRELEAEDEFETELLLMGS